ncbi:T9SS type A sorting domain-containing protein, partial [candidate division GN15 bacterium]|nr:T9SS type A sorting domain-containing protein [candidate division GN15 bacterium]
FRTSGDLAYAGMRLPVRFMFMDAPTNDDNTLGDTLGVKIAQEDIDYTDGFVDIHDIGQILVGDINLNGLKAEIGDVIYFTNYFIDPVLYAFDALQYANSDVNRDNIGATVSDLVALINIVLHGESSGKVLDEHFAADFTVTRETGAAAFSYNADFDLGGALVVLSTEDEVAPSMVTSGFADMELVSHQSDGRMIVLLYSMDGHRLPAGNHELLQVAGLADFSVERVELGSVDGHLVEVAMSGSADNLPSEFALEQNYPNPFNPETRIDFSLPQAADVRLTVYNVLGRRVADLVAGPLPAGRHSVVWEGTDEYGQAVASGVYLYRLEAGVSIQTRKMLLLK